MEELYTCTGAWRTVLQAADGADRRWTDGYCLFVALGGQGRLEIDGEQWIMHPGAVFFCNPDRLAELRAADRRHLEVACVRFRIVRRSEAESEEGVYRERTSRWLPDGELESGASYRAAELIRDILAASAEADDMKLMRRDMLLYELLLQLRGNVQAAEGQAEAADHRTSIRTVIAYLQQHYSEEITRDAMAALAGFHPRVFSGLFKQETGIGFADYLAGIRIRKAKEQLLLTRGNLDEIARNVGYSNGLYLSRKFKQETGLSPKAYLREPKRVVIYDLIGSLLALGVKPVGASYFYGLANHHLLKEELRGIADVGRTTVQPVIDLEPELIVVPLWLGSELIGKLQAIAPTMIVPYGDPVDRMRRLADALGKRAEAEACVSGYMERAKQVREEIGEVIALGETVGLYELSADSVWVFSEFHGRGGYNLYRAMGLEPPENVRRHVMGKGMITEVRIERLPEYAADHMFVCYPFASDSEPWVTRMMRHPVWSSLEAYRRNRIYFINRKLFHSADMLSMIKQLELQRELLLKHGRASEGPCVFVHKKDDFNA
ncbi:helix-turn-helix domain-containing protein [Cohnella cellulosilytica]|uniref:Helix-turn-helix domain-containing protein n=1 Tax=Cohnella cellulosilytica TaxID=986710 RepID=A0ABW2FBS5_9BACL